MKKSIAMAVLGVIASVTGAYADGYIFFSNYTSVNPPPITYSLDPNFAPPGKAGVTIGSEFNAELAWFNGVTTNPSDLTLLPGTITPFGLGPQPATDGDAFDGAGFFYDNTEVTLPGYSSGKVTLEVLAFNAGSLAAAPIKGVSSLFLMTPAPAVFDPPPPFPTNGPNAYQNFTVAVPEPARMALGGLSLAGLLFIRRRQ